MLNNTYIKNVGSTQTIIGNNCSNHVQEIDWNAKYDGDQAKILVKTNSDGRKNMYHYTLDNADLADMLNIDSVNTPIHIRLKKDFKKPVKPIKYRIEMPTPKLIPRMPSYLSDSPLLSKDSLELLEPDTFLSSPASNQEFIVPVTLDQAPYQKYTFTPKRRNLTLKTHRTHRVFKRPKSSRRRRRTSARIYRTHL